MPPKKGDVPGYYPVSDDENSKGPKKSRRSGKKTKSTEVGPSVSSSPLPVRRIGLTKSVRRLFHYHPLLHQAMDQAHPIKSHRLCIFPDSNNLNLLTTTEHQPGQSRLRHQQVLDNPFKIPASLRKQSHPRFGQPSLRRIQILVKLVKQLCKCSPRCTRSYPSSTDRIFRPAKSANTPGPTGMIPDRRLDGSHVPKENVSAGVQPEISHGGDLSKEKGSNLGGDKQQFARLKGHPSRPEHGTEENMVFLVFNHFQLKHRPSLLLWHYDIKVDPEVKGRKLTQIIKTALNHGHYKEHKSYMATDFSAVMLSAQELPYEYAKFKLSYQTELETQASDNAKEYWVSLVLNGTIDVSKIYLDSTETSSNGFPVEQALDIVLGHHRKLSDNIAIVNKRKAFSIDNGADEYDAYDLGDGALTALRGYFSSVRMSESGPLVNINVSHGAFYKAPRPLSEVIQWFESLRSVDRSKISGLLRGLRVNSSHIPRIWTIWGYPRDGDGKGYMLHPPRFNPPGAASYTPEQVSFFLVEKPKESSRDQAQVLSDQDKENAGKGDLHPHDKSCSCQGTWLTVAKYFATGTLTSQLSIHYVLTCFC